MYYMNNKLIYDYLQKCQSEYTNFIIRYIKTTVPKNWMINSRMHLTRDQVAELLPHLQKFVENDEL